MPIPGVVKEPAKYRSETAFERCGGRKSEV
jgi:hypothetical protein